jgi:steroid delta-isomerase-like uncharacterized protein
VVSGRDLLNYPPKRTSLRTAAWLLDVFWQPGSDGTLSSSVFRPKGMDIVMAKDQSQEKLLQNYLSEVWHHRNPEAVEQFLHPNFQRHVSATGQPLTRDQQKKLLRDFQAAFPDAQITLDQVVVEGEAMAFRSTLQGTHLGIFRGIPPTGRRVTARLVDFVRVQDGLFAEQWGGPDLLDLLLQLGARVAHE